METNVTNFNFQGNNVRVINENGNPMFVASDVAKVLGYEKPQNAVLTHCKRGDALNWGTAYVSHENGIGGTNVTVIGESNVYRLVLRSKLPDAERFQDWVVEEVLPSIRKYGVYATPQTIDSIISDPENGIKLLQALRDERTARMIAEKQNRDNAPKVLFSNAVSTSKTSILIGELAKILKQNGIEIGQNRMF